MSVQEQQEAIKQEQYPEALRYMDNAKETLKRAGKEDDVYHDRKYVRTACGTAYNGVLIALDAYLLLKGVEPRKQKSIEYYRTNLSAIDKTVLRYLNDAYSILHLAGYYEGIQNARVIKEGFETAYKIIEKIKPEQDPEVYAANHPKPSLARRLYALFI